MSKCKECKAELNEGATRCSSCGSHQDWRSHVQSVELLFGLVLAILTLLAAQPIKNFLLGTSPSIRSAVLKANEERVWFVLSNSGNGDAVIENIRINANKHGKGAWDTVLEIDNLEERLLKPGEVRIVSVLHKHKIPQLLIPGEVSNGNKDDCSLSVAYYELNDYHVMTGNRFRCYTDKAQ
jgi:hypothetical protein